MSSLPHASYCSKWLSYIKFVNLHNSVKQKLSSSYHKCVNWAKDRLGGAQHFVATKWYRASVGSVSTERDHMPPVRCLRHQTTCPPSVFPFLDHMPQDQAQSVNKRVYNPQSIIQSSTLQWVRETRLALLVKSGQSSPVKSKAWHDRVGALLGGA